MDDDPARRRRPSLPRGGHPPPAPPPRPLVTPAGFPSRHFLLPPAAFRFPGPVPGSGGYQLPPALSGPAAGGGGGGGGGCRPNHARSLSQPSFFPMDMDYLAPSPYSDLAATAAIPLSPPPSSSERGPSGLPPLRPGHRRSKSDAFMGFSEADLHMPPPVPVKRETAAANGLEQVGKNTLDGLVGSFINPKGLSVLGSSGEGTHEQRRERDHLGSDPRACSPGDSSENEAESERGSMTRHSRSLSLDSFVGKLNFGTAGLEPSNLPLPSPGKVRAGGLARSGSGSIGGASALFAAEFTNGEFTETEKKKIIANDRLAEMALTDPKKVKRILNNRVSAAKSKERKMRYMSELERKVHVLQMEATTLSAELTMEQREYDALATANKEMKIRLHAMEQQAQLREALNEALSAEVYRLKLANGEISDPHMSNGLQQQMGTQMIQLQQLQIQRQPSESQQAQEEQPQQSEQLQGKQQWNF